MTTSPTQTPVNSGWMHVRDSPISLLQCSLCQVSHAWASWSLLIVCVSRSAHCQEIFRNTSCINQPRQTSVRRHPWSCGTTRMPSQPASSPGFVWSRSSMIKLSVTRLAFINCVNRFRKNSVLQKCTWGEHPFTGRSTVCFDHKSNTYWRMRWRKSTCSDNPSYSLQ